MDYTKLAAELNNDPEDLGYAEHIASGADGELAALLNAPRYDAYQEVLVSAIQSYFMQQALVTGASVATDITRRAADPEDPAHGLCVEVAAIFPSRLTVLDFGMSRVRMIVDALETAGILTSAQKADLYAMGTKQISRAEDLFKQSVSHSDIAMALRG